MKFKFSSRTKKILDRISLVILVAYIGSYLVLTIFGEYRGPVASGRTKLFDWGWSALDSYIWQPKYLMLKRNNYNVGGLVYSPLILLDRMVWHRDKPI